MKCCGVFGPKQYTNKLLSKSCCPYYVKDTPCNITNAYVTGCYPKFLVNFHENHQMLIWASITFNTLTVCRNISFQKLFEILIYIKCFESHKRIKVVEFRTYQCNVSLIFICLDVSFVFISSFEVIRCQNRYKCSCHRVSQRR